MIKVQQSAKSFSYRLSSVFMVMQTHAAKKGGKKFCTGLEKGIFTAVSMELILKLIKLIVDR